MNKPTPASAPRHTEYSAGELDVAFVRLEMACGGFAALLDNDAAGIRQRRAGHDHGTRSDRGEASRRKIGAVSLTQLDQLVGHAQSIGHHLRERGLVALTVRLCGDDEKHTTFFGKADVRALVPGAADAFEKVGDAL